MVNLYLIRHAESEANKNEIFAGVTDYPLSEKGLKQAEDLKNKIFERKIKIDKIFSSPLSRTIQTITPTANALNLPILKNDGLIEMNVGDWEDLTFSQIYELNPEIVKRIMTTDEFRDIPNQETHREVSERMFETIQNILSENDEKNIAIVSHSIAIRSFLCKIFDIPFTKIHEKLGTLENASITTLTFDENSKQFTMQSFNK